MAKLIRIDRNGTKYFEGMVECDRCQGRGLYATGVCNGHLVITPVDSGICHKCHGAGKVYGKWVERTPEYQAKLDARREKKAIEAARKAEEEARIAEEAARKAEEEAEAARKAEEARIKAEKAISQYVGNIGERMTFKATFLFSAWFEVRSFSGFGTDTMYVHNFKDADGNKFVWKTGRGFPFSGETQVEVTGTVKDHSEYNDEKQTILTRCKVKKI